jgi:pro-sigmaK processing inhibitor BofA
MTMLIWQYLLIIAAVLATVLLVSISPGPIFRLLGRLGFNVVAGLALLLVINAVSARTGLQLPLNWCTLGVGAVLGAPGMAALAVVAAI